MNPTLITVIAVILSILIFALIFTIATRNNEKIENCLRSILFFFLRIVSLFSYGFVISKFNHWFVVPIYNLPELPILYAMGITGIVALLRPVFPDTMVSLMHKKEPEFVEERKAIEKSYLIVSLITPWTTLLFGWVISLAIAS